jgi:cell wall-associated NlpC family hydrolase
MRKHHSRHRVVRSVVGLTGTLAGALTLSFNDTLPVHADGAIPSSSPYWLASTNGSVTAYGGAPSLGSTAAAHPVVALVPTRDSHGYWLVQASGTVSAFGDATNYGSAPADLASPVVGLAPTSDGGGYWLVASDGGVFSFGDAGFFGSTGAEHLNRPIVGLAPTPGGGGYWLVASDGGVFTFGSARFFGSAGAVHLASPVVGLTPTADGGGYWLVASDGGVFTYGSALFFGSSASSASAPVEGLVATDDDAGYRLIDSGGGARAFGDANETNAPAAYGAVSEPAPQPPVQPQVSSVQQRAEQFALAQVGKAYYYGASGPSAYDCSGLTYRSYANQGVVLPRTAAGQYDAGQRVPVSQAQPGDLLFWASNRADPATIYHVGLYVGGGLIVNATRPGSGVQVMPASELGAAMPMAVRP